jgi:crotonobetainyl-CoA:carnitine CoA-transferase CaiB-like acyl-CoA transferase
LVRATTGVTALWTSDAGGFYDATTVFPDHVAARITAIAALAALISRDRAHTGAHVHISQAEAAINQLATLYVTEAARIAPLAVADDPAVHGIHPCDGDDEWCVISVRSQADRDALEKLTGGVDVSEWTRTQDKATVSRTVQQAGVPAAPMYRAIDVLDDPQVRFRRLYTDMVHPLFDEPMPSETGPAPYTDIPPADLQPAPMPGEHTRRICRTVLAMSGEDIDRLIADGVLFTNDRKQET